MRRAAVGSLPHTTMPKPDSHPDSGSDLSEDEGEAQTNLVQEYSKLLKDLRAYSGKGMMP